MVLGASSETREMWRASSHSSPCIIQEEEVSHSIDAFGQITGTHDTGGSDPYLVKCRLHPPIAALASHKTC